MIFFHNTDGNVGGFGAEFRYSGRVAFRYITAAFIRIAECHFVTVHYKAMRRNF